MSSPVNTCCSLWAPPRGLGYAPLAPPLLPIHPTRTGGGPARLCPLPALPRPDGAAECCVGAAQLEVGGTVGHGGSGTALCARCIGGRHGVYEDHVEFLEKHFHLITMKEYIEKKKILSEKIRAIYVWYHKPVINEELLQSLPNLKIVASAGVGIDHLDLNLLSSYGVKVSNTPFAVSTDTADLAMALMLASSRRLVEGYQMAVSSNTEYFPADWLGDEVSGKTLGIVGMGTIGYKVAERAKGFEMKILYHNRNQRNKEEESAVGAIYCKKLDDLLQQSDFVLLSVILTPQTHKLIGKRELELMKPTTTLINISRGLVVDQDALVEALHNKVIKAAALDVTYPEPLPRDHPLLQLKNVIITPHIGSATRKSRRVMMENMTDSIRTGLAGLPVPHEVLL